MSRDLVSCAHAQKKRNNNVSVCVMILKTPVTPTRFEFALATFIAPPCPQHCVVNYVGTFAPLPHQHCTALYKHSQNRGGLETHLFKPQMCLLPRRLWLTKTHLFFCVNMCLQLFQKCKLYLCITTSFINSPDCSTLWTHTLKWATGELAFVTFLFFFFGHKGSIAMSERCTCQ